MWVHNGPLFNNFKTQPQMKFFTIPLVTIAAILLSISSNGQMTGNYYVNGGDSRTSFANFTGPRNSVGTISCNTGSATVTGVGTNFTAAMVGANLYVAPSGGQIYCPTYIGTIQSRT